MPQPICGIADSGHPTSSQRATSSASTLSSQAAMAVGRGAGCVIRLATICSTLLTMSTFPPRSPVVWNTRLY